MFTPPWPIDFGPDFCLTFSGNGDLESDHDFLAGNRQFLRQKGTAGSNLARSATQSSVCSLGPFASRKVMNSGRKWPEYRREHERPVARESGFAHQDRCPVRESQVRSQHSSVEKRAGKFTCEADT